MKWHFAWHCKLCGKTFESPMILDGSIEDIMSQIAIQRNLAPVVTHHCASGDIGLAELIGAIRAGDETEA